MVRSGTQLIYREDMDSSNPLAEWIDESKYELSFLNYKLVKTVNRAPLPTVRQFRSCE